MCVRAGCNGGRRRRKPPEELGGPAGSDGVAGRCVWGGAGGQQRCVVKSGVLIQGLLTC